MKRIFCFQGILPYIRSFESPPPLNAPPTPGGLPVHRSAAIGAGPQVAQQQHTVFNRSAAAELATLTSGAAAAAQPAVKPCGRTRNKLEAMYRGAQPAFKAYFFTNQPGTKKAPITQGS